MSERGWRCTDCGTVVVQDADEWDSRAREAGSLAAIPAQDAGPGCPLCPYQTRTEPVLVTATRRVLPHLQVVPRP